MGRAMRVTSLDGLKLLADNKKSVVITSKGWAGHRGYLPAAWVLNYPGSVILNLLKAGIYEYAPESNREKNDVTTND